MDDLDHLLVRLDRTQHFLTDGAGFHVIDELLGHGQRHISLEQRNAHLAQHALDIALVQGAAFAEAVKNPAEAVGKAVKHGLARFVWSWSGLAVEQAYGNADGKRKGWIT